MQWSSPVRTIHVGGIPWSEASEEDVLACIIYVSFEFSCQLRLFYILVRLPTFISSLPEANKF